jgi:WD40 repeat protein
MRAAGLRLVVTLLVIAIAPTVSAQDGAKPTRSPNPLIEAIRNQVDKDDPVDALGDALPRGMIQRLGNDRHKVVGWWRQIAFAGRDEWIWIKADNSVSVIHRKTGRVVHQSQLRLGNDRVRAIAASFDGSRVAVATSGRPDAEQQMEYRVTILSALTTSHVGELKWREKAHGVRSVALNDDSSRLLTVLNGGHVRLWNVDEGTVQHECRVEMDVKSAAISPDGLSVVLSGSPTSYLWKPSRNVIPVPLGDVLATDAVCFAPHGKSFATISRDGVRLWEVSSGAELARLRDPMVNYANADFGIGFTPNGRTLAVPVHSKNEVELWDVESKVRVAVIPADRPRGTAISHNGEWLAISGQGLTTQIVDLKTRKTLEPVGAGHAAEVSSVKFSGPEQIVSVGGATGRIWEGKNEFSKIVGTREFSHDLRSTSVRGLAVSPDGSVVVTSADDGTLGVWESATGKRLFTLKGHGQHGDVRVVQFTRDGKQFVSYGDDGMLRRWNVLDGTQAGEFKLSVPEIVENGVLGRLSVSIAATLTHDARTLFVRFEKELFEFDTETGQQLRRVPFNKYALPIAVSADGRWLAAAEVPKAEQGDVSQRVVLRDRKTLLIVRDWPVADPLKLGVENVEPEPRQGPPWQVAQTNGGLVFSPDSLLLAWSRTGPTQGIDIVEVNKNYLHASIPIETTCWCLDFSPNAYRIAAGNADSTISVWSRFHPWFVVRPKSSDGQWVPANRSVRIRVVDKSDRTPIPGIVVSAKRWEGRFQNVVDEMKTTDAQGTAVFEKLDAIHYQWEVASTKAIPYIGSITNSRQDTVVIALPRACELTLRAIDAETGKGIPGVQFGRERALAEFWLQDVEPDTIDVIAPQVKPPAGAPIGKQPLVTDAEGRYRCLVGAATWSYSVSGFPPGYDSIEPIKGLQEVEIATPEGGRIEYTFKLLRAKAK